ncbi:MAG: hypothetical protein RLO50_14530 [Azospirillaceae bacterium]
MSATNRTTREGGAEPSTQRRLANRVDDCLTPLYAATDRLQAARYILEGVTTETEAMVHDQPNSMLERNVSMPLAGALAVLSDAMKEHAEGMERLLKLIENLSFFDVEGSR